jgi:predicted lipoprotein
MVLRSLALILLAPLPSHAGVTDAVQRTVLPGYAEFTAAAASLADAAAADCRPETLRDEWGAAFDAWMGVSYLRIGPVEDDGMALAIAYWPDPKGAVQRAVAGLLAPAGPDLADASQISEISVAGRGLFGLERLLFNEPQSDRSCAATRAVAADLSRMAEATEVGWTQSYADALTTAGATDNTLFLSPVEARQALFTQLVTGLEFTADQRLGRPLGTFERPRPERAEAKASGRSVRNVQLSLAALERFALALSPDSPRTEAAFARARALAEAMPGDALSRLDDAQVWLKVDILQQAVHAVRDAAMAEIGPALGVGLGFNAADGD